MIAWDFLTRSSLPSIQDSNENSPDVPSAARSRKTLPRVRLRELSELGTMRDFQKGTLRRLIYLKFIVDPFCTT